MDTINVNLYGGKGLFGGRETPLEASVISCDRYRSCSYFANGHCLKVRSIGSSGCKFGSVTTVRGYTSRARKYYTFKREWESHCNYNKLSSPPQKLGLIDDFVVFPYPFTRIEERDGNFVVANPSFSNGSRFIPRDRFDIDLIYRICTFRPQAMLGGEIRDHQAKTVPLFLSHLKEVLPDLYERFIVAHPQFTERIDYLGRTALLATIAQSTVLYRSRNYPDLYEEWYWDGTVLTYQGGRVSRFNVTSDYDIEEIRIRPSSKSTITITSSDQVTPDTVFVD